MMQNPPIYKSKEDPAKPVSEFYIKLFLATFFMTLAFLSITTPANAQTITMSNPGGIAERDIMVYFPNGTLQGFYNSTSVITLDASTDYIFAMKPISSNFLEDPADWATNTAMPWLETNWLWLAAAAVLIALATRR